MAYIPPQKDTVHFVGGLGNKSGRSNSNGGGCTKTVFDANNGDWSKFMTSTGAAVVALNDTNVTITSNGAGKCRITKTGAGFDNITIGTLARVWDMETNYPDYTGERVEVIAVDTASGNWCDVEMPYNGDESDISFRAGGAFASLMNIVDDDSADATDYNRRVYTNINENNEYVMEVGNGGNPAKNTWFSIIGCDSNGYELTVGNYVELGHQNEFTSLIDTYRNENIIFKALKFKDINNNYGSGIWIGGWGVASRNIVVDSCCFDGTSGKYGIYIDDDMHNVLIVNCTFESFGGTIGIYFEGGTGHHIFDCNINANGKEAIKIDYNGPLVISGNIIKNATKGIRNAGGLVCVFNNTFYNATDKCISMEDTDVQVIEYNNIFHVETPGSDYAIYANEGSIIYSGYSCTNATTNGLLNAGNLGLNYIGGSLNGTDPQFLNAGSGDFSLKTTSPCLNSGKSTKNNGCTSMGAWQRSQKIACRLIH